jgi:hypothetical protein
MPIINIFKNNKFEKIENMKRTNINKCIQWCEKYKIPYNNCIELTNIFYSKKKIDDKQEYFSDIESDIEINSDTENYEENTNLDKFTELYINNINNDITSDSNIDSIHD